MKQRVALTLVLAGLVSSIHWGTVAGARGPSPSVSRPAVVNLPTGEGHEEKPLLCLDEGTEPGGFDCSPGVLADRDDPPIDMRPVDIETVDM